eukprot:1854430-Rhodomonas_salina.2
MLSSYASARYCSSVRSGSFLCISGSQLSAGGRIAGGRNAMSGTDLRVHAAIPLGTSCDRWY